MRDIVTQLLPAKFASPLRLCLCVACLSLPLPLAAATQGTLGDTSTGTVEITLNLGSAVRISGLADIELDAEQGADAVGATDICIFHSGGINYQLNALGSGTANAFELTTPDNSVAYAVTLTDRDGSNPLTPGVPYTASLATSGDDPDCSVNGPNARLLVSIDQAATASAPRGIYTGTLTLIVAAE